MKQFMDEDFLLESDAAKTLYHDYAAKMPIVDYHCHIIPQQILDDKQFSNISEVWLGGDHYKWRAMRCNGIAESAIIESLEKDPYLVFKGFLETMVRSIGNPVYHWTYLELKRYFGIDKQLCPENAKEIYDACNEKLKQPNMSVRGLIRQSNVKVICSTDDPLDDLHVHQQLAKIKDLGFKVLPAFRPDKAVNIDKEGFSSYITRLAEVADVKIQHFADVLTALSVRLNYFKENNCSVSDHGLDYVVFEEATDAELESIFTRVMHGEGLSEKEAAQYKTAVLRHLAKFYAENNWVMQIHFGCIRNNSKTMFKKIGADTGFDCVGDSKDVGKLVDLLNAFEEAHTLPQMVLYSLNSSDNSMIATIAGSFETNSPVPSRIQLGSGWWFNDNKSGMINQLTDFANLGTLGNFVGMLTDSRSFLSYTRHEYFRRILCNLVGGWMENGEVYPDMAQNGKLVQDISYNNAMNYFGFDK